ncbi:16S rRNA (guanine(527)-N(7))-methyltransferase RsmG [Candidatus Paracaedibacter symbiosus]|uniref:16S rRNA (guanine(527)-N(7))-methyltransferase RsmG n=1 Tax=Candidatus Paracaedibacter symbiosus TaxID=244582 RepID=UPI00068E030D|nr:16S rRNA (guanine(527)-N(7))-methyltransferase RsmG [Candidatus Paracaedibacter symbiosus]
MNNLIFNYVSHETISSFEAFITLIKKWNRKTGLVQVDTLDAIWDRHILDSLQIIPFIGSKDNQILDIGTGGGFPGILLAIAGFTKIELCESNIRKTVFLTEAVRELKLPTKVIHDRVENISTQYDVIVSRACASLELLLQYMKNVSRETGTTGVFLKGKTASEEIDTALEKWDFDYDLFPSITAKDSKIIVVRNLKGKGNK